MTVSQRERLVAELAELEGPARAEIVEAIKLARGHGDLSENFEYHAAKDEQALLERRIAILRSQLSRAVLVETSSVDVACVGARVIVEDDAGERIQAEVSNLGGEGAVSTSSPLGQCSWASGWVTRSRSQPRAASGKPASSKSTSTSDPESGSARARRRAQTVTLTGEVAIQMAVRRKTAQPMESIATRSLGDVSLVLMPAKNSADANRTTPRT